jgi:hypothetical protein
MSSARTVLSARRRVSVVCFYGLASLYVSAKNAGEHISDIHKSGTPSAGYRKCLHRSALRRTHSQGLIMLLVKYSPHTSIIFLQLQFFTSWLNKALIACALSGRFGLAPKKQAA